MTGPYAGNLNIFIYTIFHLQYNIFLYSLRILLFSFDYFLKIKMFRIVSSELMFYIKSLESIDALPKEEMALQSMNDIWNENFLTNNGH